MVQLPQYVIALLDNIAASERLSNYTIELQSGSKHGDGFLGVMVSVVLNGLRHQNNATAKDKLHLLCKLAPDNPARRAAFLSDEVFAREVLAYNKILPLFAEFQREKGLTPGDGFSSYPKCYAAICDVPNNQFVVIMEDLRPQRFVMWPKDLPLTAQHMFAVVEQLAKFHAISFALKDQRPEAIAPFTQIDELLIQFFERCTMGKTMQSSLDRVLGVLTDAKHIAIAGELKLKMMDTLKECAGADAGGPHGVLSHGDLWINNMLFKYSSEQTEKLDEICIVDWQLMRYGSPAVELIYTVFSSTDKQFRQKEYNNLMKHYHTTLASAIQTLGSDPEKLYSLAAFKQDLKKFGRFGFLMTPMVISVMLADPTDIPDLDKLGGAVVAGKDDVGLVSGISEKNQKLFHERMNDIFTDLVDLGYWN